jgi:hypothetical protein
MKPFIALGCVALTFSSAAVGQTVFGATELAKRSLAVAGEVDHRTALYNFTDSEYVEKLRERGQLKQALDEVLNVKVFANRKGNVDFSADEKRFLEFSRTRAALIAAISIVERRAREKSLADDAALEKRANEIYLASDRANNRRELAADFQHIVFDLRKRTLDEVVKRVEAAQRDLKGGLSFDDAVLKYTDQENLGETKGRISNQPARTMDGVLSKTLFEDLKPGEHSRPIPSRLGLHIVKLHAVMQPSIRPFSEVKDAIKRRLVEEAASRARQDFLDSLGIGTTVFNEEAIAKLVAMPSEEAFKQASTISREKAREAINKPGTPLK